MAFNFKDLPVFIRDLDGAAPPNPQSFNEAANAAHVVALQESYRKFFEAHLGLTAGDPALYHHLMNDLARMVFISMVVSTAIGALATERSSMMSIAKDGYNGDKLAHVFASLASNFCTLLEDLEANLNISVLGASHEA